MHGEQALFQIHIGFFELQRFTDAQTRPVEQQQQRPQGGRRQALARSFRRDGLEQTPQLLQRV